MTVKTESNITNNQPRLPSKGSVEFKRLVTEQQGGDPFIRHFVVIKHRYQLCRWVYKRVRGKLVRRLEVIKEYKRRPGSYKCQD